MYMWHARGRKKKFWRWKPGWRSQPARSCATTTLPYSLYSPKWVHTQSHGKGRANKTIMVWPHKMEAKCNRRMIFSFCKVPDSQRVRHALAQVCAHGIGPLCYRKYWINHHCRWSGKVAAHTTFSTSPYTNKTLSGTGWALTIKIDTKVPIFEYYLFW